MTDNEAAILIPTFVTILVFVLGLIVKWVYDHIQKYKSVKTYTDVVFTWTDIIIDAVKAQSQSLKDLSKGLSETESLYPQRYAFSRSMSDKLSELSAEKVVSVFVMNRRCRRKVEDKRKEEEEIHSPLFPLHSSFFTLHSSFVIHHSNSPRAHCPLSIVHWRSAPIRHSSSFTSITYLSPPSIARNHLLMSEIHHLVMEVIDNFRKKLSRRSEIIL